jgi:RES domain-containing protein
MEVFRLAREKYIEPLSGKGAALRGARWNSVGIELIYTAGNRSLAMAEVAVHLTFATLPADYYMLTIHIPDDLKTIRLSTKDLPADWRNFPHPVATQQVGDRFVSEGKSAVLIIPSVVTQGDYNVLINPNHSDFRRIFVVQKEKFPFDPRLVK